MVAKIKLHFCTEEVSVLVEGQNFSSLRYLNPITKFLYHNHKIAACNPLYADVVKLENSSFHKYGETVKKFNRKIYQRSMNSNLNVSNENLDRRLFSTSDIKQSQIARTIRHNSKGIISQEAFRDSDGKNSHEDIIYWNDQFQHEIFLEKKEITISWNLKTESSYIWLKATELAVSVLTAYLIFRIVQNFAILFIY